MLRASAEKANAAVNLNVVTDPAVDSGVPHGQQLIAFADAVTGASESALDNTRTALLDAMGSAALVQAAAIAANFSMNDRAANAIGIPMESMFLGDSVEFREALGINRFPSARNTLDR